MMESTTISHIPIHPPRLLSCCCRMEITPTSPNRHQTASHTLHSPHHTFHSSFALARCSRSAAHSSRTQVDQPLTDFFQSESMWISESSCWCSFDRDVAVGSTGSVGTASPDSVSSAGAGVSSAGVGAWAVTSTSRPIISLGTSIVHR